MTPEQIRQIAELPETADFRFKRGADGLTVVVVVDSGKYPLFIYEDGTRAIYDHAGQSVSFKEVRVKIK